MDALPAALPAQNVALTLRKKRPLSEKQKAHLAKIHAARTPESLAAMQAKSIVAKKEKTLQRERIEKESEQKLLRGVDAALTAQLISMKGTHRVVIMTKDDNGKMQVETIRDMKHIDRLITSGEYGKDYLILAGAEPDWRAADAFLNRALGRPAEHKTLDITKRTYSLVEIAQHARNV